MVKYIILLALLAGNIYNFIRARNNLVYVKKQAINIVAIIVFACIITYIFFKYDSSVLGFIIVILAILFISSFAFLQGFSSKDFIVFLGATFLLKLIRFSDIKETTYRDRKSDEFEVLVNAFGSSYNQIYKIEDKEKVLAFLRINNI